ncbi:MAG: hypothetical protein WCL38_03730, partial [Actinomycetota bacterium]
MNDWGSSIYGDPCRECGFDWNISLTSAISLVADLPAVFGRFLAGRSGSEQGLGLSWSVAEYVTHVADNLRIWAERLMGSVAGGPLVVGSYDENELARACNYRQIPIQAALWSLTRSVDDWLLAPGMKATSGVVLIH